MNFAEWVALKGMGATLTEVLEWERNKEYIPDVKFEGTVKDNNGHTVYSFSFGIVPSEKEKFPNWYKAKVLAFDDLHNQVNLHTQDAATPKK